MKNLKFDIVNIEEFSGQKAQIYSIMFEGDDMTLMDHFFEDFSGEYKEDLDEMSLKLRLMGNDYGCRLQYFRVHEGAPADGVVALRCHHMRLYCLRYDNTCIFIGSGGYKSPDIKAYQEDPVLYSKALEMRKIAVCINKAIKDRELRIREDGTLDISDLIELEI